MTQRHNPAEVLRMEILVSCGRFRNRFSTQIRTTFKSDPVDSIARSMDMELEQMHPWVAIVGDIRDVSNLKVYDFV